MSHNGKHILLEGNVHEKWIDYNDHMSDFNYAMVFSNATDHLIEFIGINKEFRYKYEYSVYTIETHLTYLKEAHKEQFFRITVELLDYDKKRLHIFFVMENSNEEKLATSEQMLIGIDVRKGRSAPFPSSIVTQIHELATVSGLKTKPEEVGRKVEIRRKNK